MIIEEIIKVLEQERACVARQGEGGCDRDCARCDLVMDDKVILQAYDAVTALLRTHPDNQANEPLTLEELRGMEGQPVWMVGDDGFGRNGWCFIRRVTYDTVEAVATNGLIYRIRTELVSRTFKFYRRPPKEA